MAGNSKNGLSPKNAKNWGKHSTAMSDSQIRKLLVDWGVLLDNIS